MIDDALKLTIDVVFPPKKCRTIIELKITEAPLIINETNEIEDEFVIASKPGLGFKERGPLELVLENKMLSLSHDFESTVIH